MKFLRTLLDDYFWTQYINFMLCFSGIRKGKLTFCVQVLSIDLFKSKNLNLKLLRKTRNYSMICFFILFYLLRKLECATFSLFSLFFTFLRVSIFPNFFMYFFTFSIFLINFVFFSFLCITLCKKKFFFSCSMKLSAFPLLGAEKGSQAAFTYSNLVTLFWLLYC